MKENAVKFLYAIDCYLLYMLSGVFSAAGVVAYYSISTLLRNDGLSGKGNAAEFIDYISDFVSGKSSLVLLVSYILVFICLVMVFKIKKKRLLAYTGMTYFSVRSAVGSVVLGAAISAVTYSLLPQTSDVAATELTGIALLCIVIGPFVEELMFRGVLIKMFGTSCGISGAVIITSALFAISHGNLVQSLYTFVLGVIICIVRIKSTSLWSACLIHMSFNIFGALFAAYSFEFSGSEVLTALAVTVLSFLLSCSGGRKPVAVER